MALAVGASGVPLVAPGKVGRLESWAPAIEAVAARRKGIAAKRISGLFKVATPKQTPTSRRARESAMS
jgi:hypothetical protein